MIHEEKKTIAEILNNINGYSEQLDELVRKLQQAGIYNYKAFDEAVQQIDYIYVPTIIRNNLQDAFVKIEEEDWEEAKRTDVLSEYQKYLDNYQEGKYRSEARLRIQFFKSREEDKWKTVNKGSIESLNAFIENERNNPHVEEARKLVKDLKRTGRMRQGVRGLMEQMREIKTDMTINDPESEIYEKIVEFIASNKIKEEDLLDAIAQDNNFISGRVANKLWENDKVTDFSSTGIDSDFIDCVEQNMPRQQFSTPRILESISQHRCTEVYFWGIPSSGKTCALGAILSVAKSGVLGNSMLLVQGCQGYDYMNRLAELFKINGGKISILPEGTPIASTYEMGFTLVRNRKHYPITCIDLAGELIRCMYKKNAGFPLKDEEEQTLATLTRILIDNRTDNRKRHFFVIEYGAEDRLYEGLPQSAYLNAAATYIMNTGIFKENTDKIYLLITKVDKAGVEGKELEEKLKQYIEREYGGFYNTLKTICEDNEIKGGKVEIVPFTLGKVCFQNYCKFNSDAAELVVEKLFTAPGENSLTRGFLNYLRG